MFEQTERKMTIFISRSPEALYKKLKGACLCCFSPDKISSIGIKLCLHANVNNIFFFIERAHKSLRVKDGGLLIESISPFHFVSSLFLGFNEAYVSFQKEEAFYS